MISRTAFDFLLAPLVLLVIWFCYFYYYEIFPLEVKPSTRPVFGIMVTRSEHWVMHKWLDFHIDQFTKLVILDGTTDESSRNMVKNAVSMYPNIIYVHESSVASDPRILNKTDNGLRELAFSFLNKEEVLGHWVVIAHADEFHLESFETTIDKAEREGATVVSMQIILALPYIEDKHHLENCTIRSPVDFDIIDCVRYCWDPKIPRLRRVGTPYRHGQREERLFHYYSHEVRWEPMKHSMVTPLYMRKKRVIGPFMVHYRIHNYDPDFVDYMEQHEGMFRTSAWTKLEAWDLKTLDNGYLYSMLKLGEGIPTAQEVLSRCHKRPCLPRVVAKYRSVS